MARRRVRLAPGLEFVHVFTKSAAHRADFLPRERDAISPVWVSWPKKASMVPTDVTEDRIREI